MNDSYPCPQCGELLEVPVALLGQPVRCGACSRVFTPAPTPFDSPVARPQRESTFDPPDTTAARGSRRTVFVVLGIVGMLGLLCCGGLVFLMVKMMKPTWQTYESLPGEFTTKFPGPPRPTTRTTGRNNEIAAEVSSRRNIFQEEFFVYYVSQTRLDEVKKGEKLLAEFADGLVEQSPGAKEIRQRISRTHAGYEALDVCLELDNGHYTQARIVLANEKIYVVGVTGPGQPDGSPWVEEFIDAFTPIDPAKTEKKPPGPNPFRGKDKKKI